MQNVPGDYYRRLSEVDRLHWWHRGMRAVARRLLRDSVARGGALLDAGCGTGGFLAWAASTRRFDRLCGVDISVEAVELARMVAPGAELYAAPLDALPFGDEEFDLVVSLDVLQHVHERVLDASLAELRRVLCPGGVLLVRTNGARRAQPERGDWRLYDPVTLAGDLERAGLTVRRITYANALPSLAAAARGRSPRAPTATLSGVPRPQRGLRAAVGRGLLELEALLLAVPGARVPYGHTLFALAERPDEAAA